MLNGRELGSMENLVNVAQLTDEVIRAQNMEITRGLELAHGMGSHNALDGTKIGRFWEAQVIVA